MSQTQPPPQTNGVFEGQFVVLGHNNLVGIVGGGLHIIEDFVFKLYIFSFCSFCVGCGGTNDEAIVERLCPL